MRDEVYKRIENVERCWKKDRCEKYGTPECNKMCRFLTQMKYMMDLSNIPNNKKRPTKLNSDLLPIEYKETMDLILSNIEYFVKHGYHLYLYGGNGTGKSTWAIKLMLNYFASIAEKNDFSCRGLYVSVSSFLRDVKLNMTYKNENFREFLTDIQNCDIVIWDDILQTRPTEFETQWLYAYINERIFAGKCNIFTCNKSPEELATINPTLHSRLCIISDCVQVGDKDNRTLLRFTDFIDSYENEEDNKTDNNEIK